MKTRSEDVGKEQWILCQRRELSFQTENPVFAVKAKELGDKMVEELTAQIQHVFLSHFRTPMSIFDGKDIIEIGCGSRGQVNFIPGARKRIGIDPLLDELRKSGHLYQAPNVELFCQRGESIGFPDDVFDFAICFNVLDHVQDVEQVLREIRRVLKPGGKLFLQVHTFEVFSTVLFSRILRRLDPTHPHHFSRKHVIGLLKRVGFSVEINKSTPLLLTYHNILFRAGSKIIGRYLWSLVS